MKSRKDDFLLGLTTLAIFAILVCTIIFLVPNLGASGRRITIHFDHELGLAPLSSGSPVVLGGSKSVGSVESVTIKQKSVTPAGGKPTERTVFEVIAKIDLTLTLFGNCQITTDQPAVGGNGSVVILNVGTPDVPLKEGEAINGLPPQSLSAAISNLSRRLLAPGGMVERLDQMLDPRVEGSALSKLLISLSDVNAITASIRTQLSPQDRDALLAKVHTLLDDLNAATAALRRETSRSEPTAMAAKASAVIDELNDGLVELVGMLKENRATIRETMQSVKNVVQTTDQELITRLVNELDRNDPNSLIAKLHASMDVTHAALTDVAGIAAEGHELIVLARPQIDRIVENLKSTSDQLRFASQEIRLAPWRLLFQPGPEDKEKLNIFETARTFAEAATYLDDAAARLQAVSAAQQVGDAAFSADEIRAISDSLKAAFERFDRAEKYLYEKLK